ncbi:hypothetical protein ACIA8G_01810 [Lentzea sp. NPDC051213]|uniref:hypothetical protein n=1 Tax=Lentzea sp. NPDC051213 TaxID=3364126 RepID=UPI003791EDFB
MGDDWLSKLHWAAEFESAQDLAPLIRQATNIDEMDEDRTALWRAVHASRPDNVAALLAVGADPLRPMMYGWSPARLSLATAYPLPTDEVLTPEELAAVEERDRLVAALGGMPEDDGYSLACVAGVDAESALRLLEAESVEVSEDELEDWWEDPFEGDAEGTIGVTTVPGGCVLVQPWGFDASMPGVLRRLTAGSVGYGMYANPKSGNQGSIHRDGDTVEWDLHPGGGVAEEETGEDVLRAHLYLGEAAAFCCAYAGLRLADDRAFTSPDLWLRLPEREYWNA